MVAGCKQRGNGVELTINTRPLRDWQIVASASEEDVRNVAEPFGLEYYIGQNVGFTAKTTANLWTRYDFVLPALKGIWIGGGVNYLGKSAGDPRNIAYFLPASTVVNSAIGIDWTMNKLRMSAQINFKNMGNEYVSPTPNAAAEPRRLLFTYTLSY